MWWLIQLHSFWTIGTPILTSHDNLPYYESMILHATNPAMKKWTSYNTHTFSCLYKCGTYCRSASGLTQHSTHCFQNPANWHASFPLNPTIWPPQTPLPTGAGPPTPSTSPILPDHPSPLYSHPVTPNSASPHWHHWITNARGVRTWVHPYLNSLILSNKYHNITDITGYRAALWHRWLWATWRCPPPTSWWSACGRHFLPLLFTLQVQVSWPVISMGSNGRIKNIWLDGYLGGLPTDLQHRPYLWTPVFKLPGLV